jgi:phospholipase A2
MYPFARRGSAFCATLSHYYKEIRPILKAAGLSKLDALLAGKEDDLNKVHPLDPALLPNFATNLRDKLPETCPESIHEASHLQLMDAGMSNNLPIYPLLRPGRDVDIIIAFDASADVKNDNWVTLSWTTSINDLKQLLTVLPFALAGQSC